MESTVVVTGVGGPAGRAVAAWLAGRGHRVVGTDLRPVEGGPATFRPVPPASDPAFPEALLALVVEEGASLVLPTAAGELPVVARLRGALRAAGAGLCLSDPFGVDVAHDKLRTAEELRRHAVEAPLTRPGPTPRDAVAAALGWPLLSKPRFGHGGQGVLVHRTPGDLLRAGAAEVVWQQFLPGEEWDLNLFVERDGTAPAAVVLRKTGLREGLVGNATGVERVQRPDVALLGIRAAVALGLSGPLDLDVRARADGAPAVLEVNARVGAHVLHAPEVLLALEAAWREGRLA